MSSRRNLFVQLFFAVLLAFAQQQAIVHELGHDFDRIHSSAKDVTGHDDAFCAKCVALSHLGHADGVAWVDSSLPSYSPPRVARFDRSITAPTFVGAYRSRAPPVSS